MATVWDMESRSLRQGPFHAVQSWSARGLSISADGTMVTAAGWGGVRLWDVATGAAPRRIGDEGHLADPPPSIGDESYVGAVAFSPTEPLVAFVRYASGPEIPEAEIWDAARRSLITTLQVEPGGEEEDSDAAAVAFSPDGRTLATSAGERVHLWDVRTGTLIREIESNVGVAVLALEFSPDGEILAMSGTEPFASLRDVASGAPIGTRLTAEGRGAMLDLSPDGRRLLMTLANGQGAVWDIDPASWAQHACALANRALTREEWERFLPGRPYEPACAG